jgi:hypothetical protein
MAAFDPRAFELLVQELEFLAGRGGEMAQSPSLLPGRLTGGLREVDVALLSNVGSDQYLVMIEARHRARPQGPDWVEQVASKRVDVRADAAVLVSASGFTRSAVQLAQREGIRLWTLERRALKQQEPFVLPSGRPFAITVVSELWTMPIVDREDQRSLPAGPVEVRQRGSDHAVTNDDLLPYLPDALIDASAREGGAVGLYVLRLPRQDGFALEVVSATVRARAHAIVMFAVVRQVAGFRPTTTATYRSHEGIAYEYVELEHPVTGPAAVIRQTEGPSGWAVCSWVVTPERDGLPTLRLASDCGGECLERVVFTPTWLAVHRRPAPYQPWLSDVEAADDWLDDRRLVAVDGGHAVADVEVWAPVNRSGVNSEERCPVIVI